MSRYCKDQVKYRLNRNNNFRFEYSEETTESESDTSKSSFFFSKKVTTKCAVEAKQEPPETFSDFAPVCDRTEVSNTTREYAARWLDIDIQLVQFANVLL
ncbi:hypothetical protein NPIL_397971 [Nephila pilipes]|uniref:Uncharacterized protein n=2 Tax=Nephila pilipes TaxID=299642 RepID=A0A8X6U658_NEPPI|nr:hypothetical protein NPIL_42681 [Nephila pilipes]GFT82297.1 hypothetical protein NPIL_397971 [Nephila pilipes]